MITEIYFSKIQHAFNVIINKLNTTEKLLKLVNYIINIYIIYLTTE